MNTLFAFVLLASTASGPGPQILQPVSTPVTQPAFLESPKAQPKGLTLYNPKGEIVAKCDKKNDEFANCKLGPGITLDDLMNAWVHAYQDAQK
jgi:hypothetical protein